MPTICLYLHAHQPKRLREFSIFDIGKSSELPNYDFYIDKEKNRSYLERIKKKSYLPANRLFLDLISETRNRFQISFSLSGVFLEQAEQEAPEVLRSFIKLADTGCCDFVPETYYHSLSSYFSLDEFKSQVKLQEKKIRQIFGGHAQVFRNTELLFYDNIADAISEMGYRGVFIEGAERVIGKKSPNFLYSCAKNPQLMLILKNYRLSDDIAFRFSDRNWQEFPLTAEKFIQWVKAADQGANSVINLFMDYETFGEHQWKETGIFQFFREFVLRAVALGFEFVRPSALLEKKIPVDSLSVSEPLTWADTERDLSAWLGNDLQREALNYLYSLEKKILKCRNKRLLETWRQLQTSDHFYYMCTKWFNDGDVHKYFNPYDTPYDAYINYMNILRDLEIRLNNGKA